MKLHGWTAHGPYVFEGKDCIAICDTDNGTKSEYEDKARLMAAAPYLLEALREVFEYDLTSFSMQIHDMVSDAIARAEGRL